MRTETAFVKMQGVGNDFVLLDLRQSAPDRDWSEVARKLCDRHFGVGADGLLLITSSAVADFGFRMFNPDGTEDFCGNGLRCAVRYVSDQHTGVPGGFTVETVSGVRAARRLPCSEVPLIEVEMEAPAFEPSRIPVDTSLERVVDYPLALPDAALQITAVSTGSTHSVTFVDRLPDDHTFFRISPLVENHPMFPARTSLMWVKVVDRDSLQMRIWERGAGETLGCGTGACAAMVAARLHGYVGDAARVRSRGGELTVRWSGKGPVLLIGPAEYVFTGRCRI